MRDERLLPKAGVRCKMVLEVTAANRDAAPKRRGRLDRQAAPPRHDGTHTRAHMRLALPCKKDRHCINKRVSVVALHTWSNRRSMRAVYGHC